MNRRLLLQALLLSLWSRAAAAAHGLTGRRRVAGERLALVTDEPASQSPTLSPAEIESLLAFGEVLVGDRALSPAERRYLAGHIEDWAQNLPGQLSDYRTAVRLLERLAGKPFSSLEIADRIRLLGRYRLDARVLPRGEDPERFGREVQLVRTNVVTALIEGYWGSPAGWAAVGYEIFPGRCGDLGRYTRPEA